MQLFAIINLLMMWSRNVLRLMRAYIWSVLYDNEINKNNIKHENRRHIYQILMSNPSLISRRQTFLNMDMLIELSIIGHYYNKPLASENNVIYWNYKQNSAAAIGDSFYKAKGGKYCLLFTTAALRNNHHIRYKKPSCTHQHASRWEYYLKAIDVDTASIGRLYLTREQL